MRSSFQLVAIAQLVMAASLAAQGRDPERDKHAIAAVMQEAVAAHRAGDPERWVALFTDDVVAMFPDQPSVSGREALRRIARERFARFNSRPEITPVEIVVSGDWGFARTKLAGMVTPKGGGAPETLDGKELAIFHREPDGSWKVARLMGNSNR